MGVARTPFTLAGGRAGTAGSTPEQIEDAAEAARARGRETQVTAHTVVVADPSRSTYSNQLVLSRVINRTIITEN